MLNDFGRRFASSLVALVLLNGVGEPSSYHPVTGAAAVLDSAMARMGGRAVLAGIQRTRVVMMTEWQRTTLDARPHPHVLSYEWSTELRDYQRPAWRYSRRFLNPTGWQEIIDLVVDSVALIKANERWGPLNVAYLDERHEQFSFTPERVLLLAAQAGNAESLPDTSVGGTRYARIRTSVNGFGVTMLLRHNLELAAVHFRAAQPSDFGLVPWGHMDVAIWYSRWQRLPGSTVTIPTQLDVYRVSRPYKRMTIIGMQLNPQIPADSFAVADSLREAFLALHNRPMYDLPLDSAAVMEGRFARFGAPGTPAGAVRVGGEWLMLEAGSAPLSVERSIAFLAKADAQTSLGGVLITATSGMGGLAWLAEHAIPVSVTSGARPYAANVLYGWDKIDRTRALAADAWVHVGSDSVRVETIDAPDFPQMAIVYVPALRWAYAWPAANAPVMDRVVEHIRRRGWSVDRVGSARSFVGNPVTPPSDP